MKATVRPAAEGIRMHLLVKTGTGGGGGGGAVATSGFSLKAALDPIEDVGKRATPWGGWGGGD